MDSNEVGADYEALVRQAIRQGLQGLDCTLVQIPTDQNGHHGVVVAAATTDRGVFRAVGEAWRDLLPAARCGETLTIAEIRAKSRALREALGMPTMPAYDVSGIRATTADGAATSRAVNAPNRAAPEAAVVAADSPETAARTTVGADSSQSSTGIANAAPTPLSGARPRSGQIASGDLSGKSVTAGATANESAAGPSEARRAVDADASAKPSQVPIDGLGTDMVSRLLHMTKRKATIEGNPAGDEEALRRLDSYFQRAFGHPLAEASRMEGQRVIQRLAADLSRAGADSGRAVTG